MNRFYKSVRAIMSAFMYLFFRIKVVGLDNIPAKGPFMLCLNHTSASDIFLAIAVCPRMLCFMAKREIFEKLSLLKNLLRKMGAFPVNRGGSDISAIKKSLETIRGGGVIAVFPEGTRYRSGPPREMKTGAGYIALRTGASVIPAAIYKEGVACPFRRVTFRIGRPILGGEEIKKPSKEEISLATKQIYSSIYNLWEMKF